MPITAIPSGTGGSQEALSQEMLSLERVRGCVDSGEYHSACEILFLLVVNITESTALLVIERAYALLLQLIPNVCLEDLDKLAEYCEGSVLYKLFLFPSLIEEQWKCAMAFGDAYLKFDAFCTAVSFYSVAVDLAEEEVPMRLVESQQKASGVVFEALERRFVSLDAYQDSLSVARGKGGEELFLEALSYVDAVRQYACHPDHLTFIQKLYSQAHQVLLKLPTAKRALYGKSSTKIQEGLFVSTLAPVTSLSENLRATLQAYRENFRQRFDSLQTEPDEVRSFQKEMTASFQELLQQQFFTPILRILRTLPCSCNFLAMGSVAREELCPYSDLEWLLVIEDPEKREGFYPFIELLDLLVRSLRESPIPQLFTALRNPEKSGLHLDMGSSMQELIIAPQFPMPRGDEEEFEPRSLPHTMCRVRTLFHQGDDLYPMFNTSKRSVLDESVEGRVIREHRALKLMHIRLAEFKQLVDPFALDIVDLKKHFAEPLFHLLGDLALYYGLEETNTLDVIDALENLFTEQSRELLKQTVAKIYHRRVELHLKHGKQHEMTSPIGFEQVQALVLEPLYAKLEVWLEKEQFEEVDLIESAFSSQVIAFTEQANLERARSFIQILKLYLGEDQTKVQHYYEKLSTDTRLEPLREMFVQEMPEDSPLLSIPNRDGYRQAFRMDYQQLDAMLMQITTDQPSRVEVIGLGGRGRRYLKEEIAATLLNEEGHIRSQYPGSAHPVMGIQGEGYAVHCKEMPTQPLMEYAVHSFTSRLMGEGTTPTRLLRFQLDENTYYPVLVSKTARGTVLSDELGSQTDAIRDIDHRSLTWMLIRAILIKPGDERASNFIIDEKGRLTCVDNDVAFVEPIVKIGGMKSKVYFKTLLPFLTDRTLDRQVIEDFLQLTPELFLQGWLEDLIQFDKRHVGLFDLEEGASLYLKGKEMQFSLTPLFRKGVIAALYTQWICLQEFLRKNSQEVHPLDLLKAIVTLEGGALKKSEVGEKLYRAYTRAKTLPLAPREKLLKVVEEKQDQSVTNMEALRASCGRTPKHFEAMNREEFAPEKALEELQLFLFQSYDDTLEVSKGLGNTHLRADFGRLQVNGQPDLGRQRLLMQALHCHHGLKSFQHVTLLNAPTLTLQELCVFFHEELKSLTLAHCPNITPDTLVELAAKCPNLEELCLENCSGITKIDDGALFRAKKLLFPALRSLHISHCENLTEANIHSPKLQELKLHENVKLQGCDQCELIGYGFGKASWEKYFGKVEEEPPFPPDIDKILQGPCPIWEGNRVQETHLLTLIPTTVNGRPLTLDILEELVQRPQGGGHATKYSYYNNTVKKEFGAQSPRKASWALMTKCVIRGSRCKSYEGEKELVQGLSSKAGVPYELPKVLDAAVSILMHHVKRGERLYRDNPMTHTRCQESLDEGRTLVAVGDFLADGLYIARSDLRAGTGVGALRKF